MSTAATNALTARWASTLDGAQTVLSGAGVYPLLALLARYAAGPARDELLAVAPDPARFDLDRSPTTRLALATWARRNLPLTDRWLREVPAAMRGELTGNPAALPVAAGPGVDEQLVDAYDDRPELLVSTVAFTASADHDLLARAALFGLRTAVGDGDHFPGISRLLAVSQARQSATATFGATGFRAAAVTAIAMRVGSAPPRHTARRRRVRLDIGRPFGFLAVHRPTGLVLLAGWVADPDGPA